MKRKFLRGKTLCATFCSTMPVIAVLMGGALAPAEASAEGIDWNSVQYVTLETADGGYGESSFLLGAHWSDGRIPHGDAHYMVPEGKHIYGINDDLKDAWERAPTNKTFQGGSLSVAGNFRISYVSMAIPNMRLLDGGSYENGSYGGLYGTATVCSVTTPFDFRLLRSNEGNPRFPYVSMTFLGDADAKVCFRRHGNNRQAGFSLYNSDFSRYYGTIINGTGSDGRGGGTNCYGNAVIPGTCIVSSDSSIKLYDYASSPAAATIGTLQMETGSVLYLLAKASGNASITVTNRFVVSENVRLVVENGETAVIGGNSRMALIKLIGNASLDANLPDLGKLVLECPTGKDLLPQGGALSMEDDETTGGKTIYATFAAVNNLLQKTDSSRSAFSMDAAVASEYWSLGHVPQDGETVRIAKFATTVKSDGDDGNFVFPGNLLMLAEGGSLYLQSSSFSAGKVYAMDGSTIETAQYDSQKMSFTKIDGIGNAQVLNADELRLYGVCDFAVAQGRNLVVNARLFGTGTVRAATRMDTSEPCGAIAFNADNTAFSGRFIAASRNKQGKLNTSTGRRLRLFMNDANNVGGDMAKFTYDGFTVSEDAIVVGLQALTFSCQTRGVFVENRARFVMKNGDRLTFNVPVTWRGEMVFGNDYPSAEGAKTGAGTGDLILGSCAMFLNDDETVSGSPDVGSTSNRLLMVVGRVKPMTTNALDGVAISFGPEAGGILLDIDPAGDGMAEYGLYDAKWDVPFTSRREDGKIPVTFEGMVDVRHEGRPFSRGICTVNATAAQSLSVSDFVVMKPYSNVDVEVTRDTNANGTVTFKASFKPKSLRVIVR